MIVVTELDLVSGATALGSSAFLLILEPLRVSEQKKNGVVVVGLIRYMGKDLTDAQRT